MIRSSRLAPRRPGTVAVLVAISLTVLMMMLAITLDAGLLYAEKRHAQAVADAAAMAGATDLYNNFSKNSPQGSDSSGTAAKAALANAASNGYSNDGTTSVVVTRTYSKQNYYSGPNAGKPVDSGRIEVTVTYYQPRYFSLIFDSGNIPITARAVAAGTWLPAKFGLLALAPTGIGLSLGGNGTVDVTTGVIQVDSSDQKAVVNQSNATIKANELDINGGLSGAGTITTSPLVNNVNYGVPPASDPLYNLPVPTQPAMASNPTSLTGMAQTTMLSRLVANGQITQTAANGIKNVYVATPGTYDGSKKSQFPSSLGSSDLVLFEPGIYYLNAYGLNLSNSALLMHPDYSGGMMFYINPSKNSDGLSITGNGTNPVTLTGITSGTYQGLIIFQSRTASVEPDIKITGNGSFNMQGTIYSANGNLNLTGNGAGTNTIGSALIAKTVQLGGNGNLTVSFSSGQVAPQRVLNLVE